MFSNIKSRLSFSFNANAGANQSQKLDFFKDEITEVVQIHQQESNEKFRIIIQQQKDMLQKLLELQTLVKNQSITSEKCVICLDKTLSVAVKPCGHVVYCHICAQKVEKICPICRREVAETLRLYFP